MRPPSRFVTTSSLLVAFALSAGGCKKGQGSGDESRSGSVGASSATQAARGTPESAPAAGGSSAAASASTAGNGAATTPAAAPDAGQPALGIPLSAGEVLSVVNPTKQPAYDGPTGIVEGRVVYDGPEPPSVAGKNFAKCPEAVRTRGKLFTVGAPDARGYRPLADAMVGITGYTGYLPERSPEKRVEIRACDEAPRTVDMTFGQKLVLVNGTSQLFGPYLEESPASNLLVAKPHGEPVDVYPMKPGRFTLADRLGATDLFRADVYVVLQPLHATSGADGRFRIEGVPVGSLTVHARLPALGREASAPVTVRRGVIEEVEIVLRRGEADAGAPATPAKPKQKGVRGQIIGD